MRVLSRETKFDFSLNTTNPLFRPWRGLNAINPIFLKKSLSTEGPKEPLPKSLSTSIAERLSKLWWANETEYLETGVYKWRYGDGSENNRGAKSKFYRESQKIFPIVRIGVTLLLAGGGWAINNHWRSAEERKERRKEFGRIEQANNELIYNLLEKLRRNQSRLKHLNVDPTNELEECQRALLNVQERHRVMEGIDQKTGVEDKDLKNQIEKQKKLMVACAEILRALKFYMNGSYSASLDRIDNALVPFFDTFTSLNDPEDSEAVRNLQSQHEILRQVSKQDPKQVEKKLDEFMLFCFQSNEMLPNEGIQAKFNEVFWEKEEEKTDDERKNGPPSLQYLMILGCFTLKGMSRYRMGTDDFDIKPDFDYKTILDFMLPFLMTHSSEIEVISNIAFVYRQNLKKDVAKKIYEWLYHHAPEHPEVLHGYGTYLYLFESDYLMAERLLRKALSIYNDNPATLNNLGHLFLQAGDASQAMLYLERANSVKPNDEQIQKNLGIAYVEAQQYHEGYQALFQIYRKPTTTASHTLFCIQFYLAVSAFGLNREITALQLISDLRDMVEKFESNDVLPWQYGDRITKMEVLEKVKELVIKHKGNIFAKLYTEVREFDVPSGKVLFQNVDRSRSLNVKLVTKDLIIRPAGLDNTSDKQLMYSLYGDESTMEKFHHGKPKSHDEVDVYFRYWRDQYTGRRSPFVPFLIFKKGKNENEEEFVGTVTLDHRSDNPGRPEICYLLLPQHWGKQYASQAASILANVFLPICALKGLDMTLQGVEFSDLVATARLDNRRSSKVLEKLKMSTIGEPENLYGYGRQFYSISREDIIVNFLVDSYQNLVSQQEDLHLDQKQCDAIFRKFNEALARYSMFGRTAATSQPTFNSELNEIIDREFNSISQCWKK